MSQEVFLLGSSTSMLGGSSIRSDSGSFSQSCSVSIRSREKDHNSLLTLVLRKLTIMGQFLLSLKQIIFILLIPAFEVIISKILIHGHPEVLIHPATAPGVDYILYQMLITGLVFLAFLNKRNDFMPLILRKHMLAINLLCWLGFLLLTFNLEWMLQSLDQGTLSLIWYGLGMITFATSFLIFFKLKGLFKKLITYPIEVLFALIAGTATLIYYLVNQQIWPFFAEQTTAFSFTVLKAMGVNVIPVPDPIILAHPLFSAAIESWSSGLEGMFFFVFIFSLILMFRWRLYSTVKIIAIYLAGIIYMFIVNIFRVVVFFIMAMPITQKWGVSETERLFVLLFDPKFGWILYLLVIGIFFKGLSFFALKKERN